jgi:CitMHS family citrate-Mg2+:H+ or citrate-Ca2+:H+ symporter
MPYIGFFAPLLIPVLVLAFFTVIYLGWKGTPLELDAIIEKLPPVPAEMSGFKVYFPFVVLALLMVATRLLPHALPILGVPLIFIISSVVALLMVFLSGQKVNILLISKRTVKQLFPLIATLVAVGIFVQILTLTGVRGLFVITVLSLPIWLVYIGLSFVLPFGEAILLYGIAAVLGIPLIFLFNSLNLNPIIATVGIILICPLGDALPPTRIIGRLTVETVGYKESYTSFLQKCMVPWIVITVVGICMVIFANSFKFLLI